MGNTNKKLQDYEVVNSFRTEDWVNLEERDGFEIWENTAKGFRADVYPLANELTTTDLQSYEMRHNDISDIVHVYNLQVDRKHTLCTNSNMAHVFIERIPLRLGEVSELTPSEALTVLRASYSGFNTISTFHGPIEPFEDLICFNEKGEPKVWVNSSLAVNSVQRER
jgi:hypothetical protein